MADIKLRVVTPIKPVIDEGVDEVVVPGELGEFGVLPGHTPLISTLAPGELAYKKGGVEKAIFIEGGIADVRDDMVNVLADNVISADEVDYEASRKEAEGILEELKGFGERRKEFKALERRLKIAELKLRIKRT